MRIRRASAAAPCLPRTDFHPAGKNLDTDMPLWRDQDGRPTRRIFRSGKSVWPVAVRWATFAAEACWQNGECGRRTFYLGHLHSRSVRLKPIRQGREVPRLYLLSNASRRADRRAASLPLGGLPEVRAVASRASPSRKASCARPALPASPASLPRTLHPIYRHSGFRSASPI